MSHRLTFTARRSALLRGEPFSKESGFVNIFYFPHIDSQIKLSTTLFVQFIFCVHLGCVHFLVYFSKCFSFLFFRQFQFPFVSRFWVKCDGSRNLLVIPLFTVYQQLFTVTDNCLLFTVYCHKSVLYSLKASSISHHPAPDNYFRSHYHSFPSVTFIIFSFITLCSTCSQALLNFILGTIFNFTISTAL